MHMLFRAALAALLLVAPIALPFAAEAREDEMAVGPNIEKEDYFRPGIAPVREAVGHDLTIVYFMDYQCPSCRQYTPDVARVLAEDRKLKVIYRDTPIISDLSTVAARAAIASAFQGRHAAFHNALMTIRGRLTEATIRAAADKAGVDWPRLQRDLKARGEAIDEQIGRNVELAVATGILGTPAFIVGDRLSNGALDYASLKAEIADARAGQAKSPPTQTAVQPEPAAAVEGTPDKAAAKTAPVAAKTPPLFRPADARPAPTEDERNVAGAATAVWLAAAALLAAVAAGWWLLRRRRE